MLRAAASDRISGIWKFERNGKKKQKISRSKLDGRKLGARILFQQKYHNLMIKNFVSDWKICLKMNLRALSHSCCLNYLYLLLEDRVIWLAFQVPKQTFYQSIAIIRQDATKDLLESVALAGDFDFQSAFDDSRSVSNGSLHV